MEQPKEIVNSDSPAKPPKKKLPTLTLFAAVWLIVVGLLGMAFVFFVAGAAPSDANSNTVLITLLLLGIFLLVILPGILLILKRIWAWVLALSLLFIGIVILFVVGASAAWPLYLISSALLFIPLILAFSDHQRYMQMASNKSPKSNGGKPTINIEQ